MRLLMCWFRSTNIVRVLFYKNILNMCFGSSINKYHFQMFLTRCCEVFFGSLTALYINVILCNIWWVSHIFCLSLFLQANILSSLGKWGVVLSDEESLYRACVFVLSRFMYIVFDSKLVYTLLLFLMFSCLSLWPISRSI